MFVLEITYIYGNRDNFKKKFREHSQIDFEVLKLRKSIDPVLKDRNKYLSC